MRYYTQFAMEQRYHIYSLLKVGFNQSQIAQETGVHRSKISWELGSNQGKRSYADKARDGGLHRHMRGQKPYQKRHVGGRDRRGQLKDR